MKLQGEQITKWLQVSFDLNDAIWSNMADTKLQSQGSSSQAVTKNVYVGIDQQCQ
ncbi:unnamed protein product [Paramecium octaurelia]|uniref:Uncharacterized protein n=1 Tax=Paramecium octaurelia TaxID=43137 RepID=A0A8S1WKV6_PAROT|nr:unnamed protein product [Paramecium octaurelia]